MSPSVERPFDLRAWSAPRAAQVHSFLMSRFGDAWPPRFQEACRYPLGTGGKRIRPLLARAAGESLGHDEKDPTLLIELGAAIELVHSYSLVHDDLPAMDDDDERRGMPTVHRAYNEATAVLVGDALLTEAFAVLAACQGSDAVRVALVRELARAAGHPGMIGGQAADVGLGGPVTGLDELSRLHRGKTGALIRASTVMGGIAAGARPDQLQLLQDYGEAVGLAFQLADDLLDADQDAGETGPPSFVRLLGAEETQARARALSDQAQALARRLPAGAALEALARFTVERDH